MDNIKKKILVMSGKGGVGKTTIAVNLAYALSEKGFKVGLLDVDVHGPNAPKMLKLDDKELETQDNKMIPIKYNDNLKVMSMAFLLKKQNAGIWRGPMKHNIIKQFLDDVEWGELDYIVVDLPPGTGDEPLSIAQLLKDITGTVIVSTPQEVSLLDGIKSIDFSKKLKIPIIGLVENMSGEIFGEGGVEETAKKQKIAFIGRIKLDAEIRKSGDSGNPHEIKKLFNPIADKIEKICEVK